MAKKSLISELSRRERQIMDVVYKRGAVSAINIISELFQNYLASRVTQLFVN